MALLRDDRDEFFWRRNVMSELAQLKTDVQRLWKLTEREQHIPFFVIGGEAGGDTIPGGDQGEDASEFTGEEDAGAGPPIPPGGPPAGGGGQVPAGCCLWRWDGSVWFLVLDRTGASCECPEPDTPGDYLFEDRIVCCPESSSEDCTVPCAPCDLPCTITLDYSRTTGGANHSCDRIVGTYSLTWVPANNRWEDATCHPIASSQDQYNSYKVSVSVQSSGAQCILTYVFTGYTDGSCSVAPANIGSGNVTIDTCDPLFGEQTDACSNNAEVVISE